MATIPNDEKLNGRYRPMRCPDPLVHGTVRALEPAAKSGWVFTFGSLKGRPVRPKKDSTRGPATHRPRGRIPVRTRTPLSHRTSTPCVYLYLYTSPRAANRPCDGRHQKRECDTNFFVCLLVRRYRIDALALPLVCFTPHCGSRTVFCHAQRALW